VTPDTAEINLQPQPETRSTAGMTTKVVKGSLWTLAGQVAPLGVSLFTTPFVIRLLGSEGYGVLILVGLIPTYFAFADFGMGIASTKFASEAYAAGDSEKEARTVRTAALIALIVSLPVAAAIFIFSNAAIAAFNVPAHLQSEANLALKLASVTFVIGFLNNIFNTPQLTRLRMDLNTFVNSGYRMLGLIATPIVIYLGGGILGAVAVLLIVALLTLAAHLYVSGKLLNHLFQFTLDRTLIRPMLNFGGAFAFAGIAAVLLVNLEKLVLAKVTTVETLAHYAVAFTLATMATMFSSAMIQSLVPAFSQLLIPEKREQLNNLFARALRLNLVMMLPILVTLFVIARPFFTIWAGEDFGRESTIPFYVLLLGVFFNVMAFVPHSLLISTGRTDILAKIYWIELFPYIALIAFLTSTFGAVGAAMAWGTRVFVDAAVLGYLVRNSSNVSLRVFDTKAWKFVLTIVVLSPPVLITLLYSSFQIFILFVLAISLIIYAWLAWINFIGNEEKIWLTGRMQSLFAR